MTSYKCILLLVFCILLIHVGASAQITDLRGWINHHPREKLGPNGKCFFDLAEIQLPLRRLLPKIEFDNLVRDYEMESAIQVAGNYLVVTVCKQHLCSDKNASAIFGLNDASIVVMYYDDAGEKRQEAAMECFSTGPTIASLPDNIKQNFLARHIMRGNSKNLLAENVWLNNIACRSAERLK